MSVKRVLLIGMLLLSLAACGSVQSEHDHDGDHGVPEGEVEHDHLHVSEEMIRQWGIEYERLKKREYVENISLTGVVRENQDVTYRVNALAAGTAIRLKKDIGEAVRRGEVLALLNSPDFLELKTRYVKAYQEYRLCNASHERARELFDIKGIELRELQKREAACKTATAEYFSLEAALLSKGVAEDELKSMKEALDNDRLERLKDFISPRYPVMAPISGTVMARNLVPGERIEMDRTLFVISDTRRVWVLLDAMENDLKFVKREARVEVVTDVYPGKVFSGRVVNMTERLDPELRTVKLRVEVENPQAFLKPEMYVTGKVRTAVAGEYPAVPVNAVVKISAVNGVFVWQGDGFDFVPLELLGSDSAGWVFVKGLSGGESVVTRGAFYLKAEYELKKGSGVDAHEGHGH